MGDISIIIPAYNVDKWISECLDSVVCQSEYIKEIIIVNDGSTDRTIDICEKYKKRCHKISILTQENKGLSAARNIGMEVANADYLLFLDADDYLAENSLVQLHKIISEFNCDAVYFDADIIGRNITPPNPYDRKNMIEEGMHDGKSFFDYCYPEAYVASSCMTLYSTSVIKECEIQFPEGIYYEDNYFTFAFMQSVRSVYYLPLKLYRRRYREGSITTSEYTLLHYDSHIKCLGFIESFMWDNISRSGEKWALYVLDWLELIVRYSERVKQKNIFEDKFYANAIRNVFDNATDIIERNNVNDSQLNDEICYKVLALEKALNDKSILPGYKWGRCVKKYSLFTKEICKYEAIKTLLFDRGVKIAIFGIGKRTDDLWFVLSKLDIMIQAEITYMDNEKHGHNYRGEIIKWPADFDIYDLILITADYPVAEDIAKEVKMTSSDVNILHVASSYRKTFFRASRMIAWE
ncbi:glycosyltransferase family 2 protein [Butyrivibrio sp. AE3006]|uniref:glycosyltransferase family 2 protein n=1 Tax=Butyrivibrio sp. AE3006 TaxID=1280673 RepID=UPI00042935D8|nr:glycosyltransferase family 2 protein [Butyrivibrio sp. AE3006]